jgi:hypothetical protein
MSYGSYGQADLPCRIAKGWHECGRLGVFICWVEAEGNSQKWGVVVWENEDEPDLIKMSALEILREGYWRKP